MRNILALLFLLLPSLASAAPPPAPAVEIVSAEFGTFDASNPKQMIFDPGTRVPHREGQRYGWIIEVKTRNRTLSVREEYVMPTPGKADQPADPLAESLGLKNERRSQVSQRQLVPDEGRIYGEWAIGPNEPAGRRQLQVIIEGQVAASFDFEVK